MQTTHHSLFVLNQDTPARSQHILVVEDDPSNLRLLLVALTNAFNLEYTLHLAKSAQGAFDLVETLSIDIALLDIELPDGSGVEVARALRQQSPHTLILMVSAQDGRDYIDQAYRAGANAFVVKPYNLGDFLTLLRELHAAPRVIGNISHTMSVVHTDRDIRQYQPKHSK